MAMAIYRLFLFLHPRAVEQDDEPNETREIEAATTEQAQVLAQAQLGVPNLFGHEKDHAVLYGPGGDEVSIFSPGQAAGAPPA